jgi:hypothetical protein
MKIFAIILIFAAFLAGSFLSVLDPYEMNWTLMVPTLLIGAVGLFLYRRCHHAETRSSDKLSGNIGILTTSLANIVQNLEQMNAGKDELPVYEARFEIDKKFRDDLTNFADARESMIHVFGIQNYADVMSGFAAGERYLNRVWSASTDGYVDEVRQYLGRALDQFHEANDHFNRLATEHAGKAQGTPEPA